MAARGAVSLLCLLSQLLQMSGGAVPHPHAWDGPPGRNWHALLREAPAAQAALAQRSQAIHRRGRFHHSRLPPAVIWIWSSPMSLYEPARSAV